MKKNKNLIIFGGNRLLENGPIGDLTQYLKKKKIIYVLITDPNHLKKRQQILIILKPQLKV